jgi:hypothetical protein
MKNKLNHISSITELSNKDIHPLIWEAGILKVSTPTNELEEEQKEDLVRLKQLLQRLLRLSQSQSEDEQ